MGVIKIINNSTLTDLAAGYRALSFMAGDKETSTQDQDGNVIVKIDRAGENTYKVRDIN